jgi:septal ring factor EnvC (AmiA/AmiB activator)
MSTGYDIEKLVRASRRSALVGLLGLLVVILAGGYSYYELSSLQEQIEQKKSQLEGLNDELEEKKKQVDEVSKKLDEMSKKLDVLNSALYEVGTTNPGLAKQALNKAIESEPDAAGVLPRIYIHIRAESQRSRAKQVADRLREKGYVVPGIEILVNIGPSTTQVRYFRGSEEKRANEIVHILKELKVDDAEVKYIRGYETSVRRGQYEIWFGPHSLSER